MVDEIDTYMGTVSLKHIVNGEMAEFAICMRTVVMGKGFATYVMHEILRIGFENFGLKIIYWSVNLENGRAVCFYEKNGFKPADVDLILVGRRAKKSKAE